jgi:hypothetical protein
LIATALRSPKYHQRRRIAAPHPSHELASKGVARQSSGVRQDADFDGKGEAEATTTTTDNINPS